MHIALLTYSTRPRGGVVHTLALAEALARRGNDVEVWTLGRGRDATFFRGVDPLVDVRVVPFPDLDGEEVGARIERSIDVLSAAFASEAEVVHAQDCISANAVARAGVGVIRTIHHLDVFTTPQLVACHDRAVVEPIARVCVSEAVAAEVHDLYGLRPTVISNGVDGKRFRAASGPAGATRRARWRAELGEYVLALGGIEPRKGSIELLEAFAMLRTRHPSIRLVFGGGQTLFDYRPYRDEFDRRALELGVEPTVLGNIADDDLPALVAAAVALGFVSTKEGFGLAAMEALAAGVPVVARDLPVLREVFGDAVAYATDVPEIADSLHLAVRGKGAGNRDAAAALVDRYTWPAAAALHERFYRAVLAQEGDGGAPIDLADPH